MEIKQKYENEVEPKTLNALDSALNELGMLATSSSSRKEYVSEIQTQSYLNMLTINTRYVSNVSFGFRVRPSAPHVRYKPYQLPLRERHRTKSENNDVDGTSTLALKLVEDCISESIVEIAQLKKAKSLETLITSENESIDVKSVHFDSHCDLELVSDGVQNLKVGE